MSESEAFLEGEDIFMLETPEPSTELPRDWEFAERIIRRLKPRNQQHVYDMAAHQSKQGGMLITLMVVTWWLFIGMKQDDLAAAPSVFFGLNFEHAALTVMGLSLCSAILTEFSKDMGKILPSIVAGGMLILAGLYVAEPLISALFLSSYDLTVQEALWRTIRLGALWGGMTYGSNLIVNAMLLNWLIRFCNTNDYDFSGRGELNQDSGSRLAPVEQ
jgi:hypothetical protein